jgi:hypothetical protein
MWHVRVGVNVYGLEMVKNLKNFSDVEINFQKIN